MGERPRDETTHHIDTSRRRSEISRRAGAAAGFIGNRGESAMTLIRCECGQALGKVKGTYEFRCPKCKRVIKGTATSQTLFGKPVTDALPKIPKIVFGKPYCF